MIKSKICFTIFVLYEITAVILLHCSRTCDAIFSGAFCDDSGFKYFIVCAAIPLLLMVVWMWIHQIFFARRRFALMRHARDIMDDVSDGVKKHLGRTFDMHDIDKYLAAAILFGIKKYAAHHPQIRNTIRDIIEGNIYDDEYEYYTVSESYAPRARATTKSRTGTGTTTRRKTRK